MAIQIKDMLKQDVMLFNLQSVTKNDVLEEMVSKLVETGYVSDKAAFIDVLLQREAVGSTGVGEGIGIPHGKSKDVRETVVLFGRSTQGVAYEALDDQPVHLFFLIATPDNSNNEHLQVLASLSGKLMHKEVVDALMQAKDSQTVFAAFDKDPSEIASDTDTKPDTYRMKVVAVTGCTTGIAHTYMAAEKLKETAADMNVAIKIQTNGASGIENELSDQDIQEADAVIVAADIHVDVSRFAGKPLLSVPVAQAIKNPTTLLKEAPHAPVHQEKQEKVEKTKQDGIYKHLMNGVSHMLPFVIGGGIIIALSFLMDQLLGIPADSLSKLGSYNGVSATLNEIGGMAFSFMLPVLAGYIAHSIADRPGLVVGFVAGGIANAGGAGFLGALLGGFLAGYLMNLVKYLLRSLPKSLQGLRTILLYPLVGTLLIGILMFVVNIPMKAINDSLNSYLTSLSGSNAALLGLLLGAMMSFDLGGPVNKAAYVFGTSTLAITTTSGSSVMAAVMAAGMVPPIAVFVATKFFKEKFSQEERQAGLTNIILGASFITEGAIPFASKNPIRVIPSFMIGSALTGAVVMALNIGVSAPHGGIFVIFLVSKPLFYLLAVALGSVVSGFILGIVSKKPQK